MTMPKPHVRKRKPILLGPDGLRNALRVFGIQRKRTILAMLGVFLGALLLTLIIHVLGGVTLLIENQGKALGSHTATLTPNLVLFTRNEDVRIPSDFATDNDNTENTPLVIGEGVAREAANTQSAATLTMDDLTTLVHGVPNVSAGVPYVKLTGQIYASKKSSTCQILGVSAGYPDIRETPLVSGRFFLEDEDHRKELVCILGYAIAERLFSHAESAVGQWVRIRYSSVRVVGVIEKRGADSSGTNMDEYVFLPIQTAMQRFSTQDHVNGIYLAMEDKKHAPAIERAIQGILRSRHILADWEKSDFSVSFTGRVDAMITNALGLVSMLGFIGAGISFAVGTLGIFSIMILMVQARRKEIGIRRAIGAPKRMILQQFLWEAGLMAGLGGALGVFAALGIAQLIFATGLLPQYFSISTALGICLLSLLCGLLAGGYPAYRASQVEVLAALRD